MNQFPTLDKIHLYFKDIDLLTEVVHQIKKDFEQFNKTISFSGNKSTAYKELFEQIYPFIDELFQNEYEKLLNVLYRIDIDEQKLNRYLQLNPMVDTSEVITDLILKRELQKVVIRKMYSKTINS